MRALFVPGLTLVGLLASAQALAQTRVVYLWYADGGPLPVNTSCAGTPPAFTCDFAGTPEGCKRAVQRHLDAWYADMDLVFTLNKPPGDYDTVIVTGDGSWCGVTPQNLGRGMLAPMCQDLRTGYAIAFQCGTDAKRCATVIAQEQAHLVGLEHTVSERDVMNQNFLTTHEGFEDALNPVAHPPECLREQNSYQKMKDRVGAWMGGPKPRPFVDLETDAGTGGSPDDASAPVDSGPDIDSGSGVGGGMDAGGSPDVLGDVREADAGGPPVPDSGCGCRLGGRTDAPAWPLLVGLIAWFAVKDRRRSWPAPGRRSF